MPRSKLIACALAFSFFALFSMSAQEAVQTALLGPPNTAALQTAVPLANELGEDADSQPARVFETTVRNLFNEEKFAQLDEIADSARSQKSRFLGGAWKLHTFYDVIRSPGALTATDEAWNAHMERLQRWIASSPNASTPRVALAESYVRFAWKARGNGYSEKVTADGWKLFGERVQKARDILEQAKAVSTKDPQWYRTLQTVALAQGWDHQLAEQLLADATTAEPTYYYFYNEHANYLLPKWYGKPGDAESFAEAIADRIGGPEGDFIYYQVALSLNCCRLPAQAPALSWQRVKQGFNSLEQLYGITSYERNAMALMAVRQGDKEVAQQLFARIGDNWSARVWGSKDRFENSKALPMQNN